MIDSSTIVGLKYKGKKKVPFTFRNENMISESISWKATGDVVDVPLADAKMLVRSSPSDFDIVFKTNADAELEKEVKPPGFVDTEEDTHPKRGPGRPKKDA